MHDPVTLRGLGADDLPTAHALLCEGFPDRSPTFWREALARLAGHRPFQAPGVALGSGMWNASGQLVGIMLTPSSVRRAPSGETSTLVNLSSWTMLPPYRWRARSLLKHALSYPGCTPLDLTPSDRVQAMLPHFGMHPVSTGTLLSLLPVDAAVPLSQPVEVQPWRPGLPLPPGSPSADLLASQQALGCVPLLLHRADASWLLAYRRVQVRGVSAADWVYVQSHRGLWQSLPAVARYLVRQGLLVMRLDARPTSPGGEVQAAPAAAEARSPAPELPAPLWGWHRSQRAHGVWYAKGGSFDDHTDFLGTERCLLGV